MTLGRYVTDAAASAALRKMGDDIRRRDMPMKLLLEHRASDVERTKEGAITCFDATVWLRDLAA